MAYDKDYVEFDEFGIVRIRCMCCGEPIVERTYTEMQSFQDPNKKEKVMAWRRLSNHAELSVRLSDGSLTGLPHCTSCATEAPIDMVKASDLRNRAARQELECTGKTPEVIDDVMVPQEKILVVMKEDDFKAGCKESSPEEVLRVAMAKLPKEILIDKGIVESTSEVV